FIMLSYLLVSLTVAVAVGLGLDVQCTGGWVDTPTSSGGSTRSCVGTTVYTVVHRSPWAAVGWAVASGIVAYIGALILTAFLHTTMAERPARLRLGPRSVARAVWQLWPLVVGGLAVALCTWLMTHVGNLIYVPIGGARFRTPYGPTDVVLTVLAVGLFFGGRRLVSAGQEIHTYADPEEPVTPASGVCYVG